MLLLIGVAVLALPNPGLELLPGWGAVVDNPHGPSVRSSLRDQAGGGIACLADIESGGKQPPPIVLAAGLCVLRRRRRLVSLRLRWRRRRAGRPRSDAGRRAEPRAPPLPCPR